MGRYTIEKYKGDASFIELPSIYNHMAITGIRDNAFSDAGKLSAILIPSTIHSFGKNIFGSSPSKNIIVYCEEGSDAENYCIDNGIQFYHEINESLSEEGTNNGLQEIVNINLALESFKSEEFFIDNSEKRKLAEEIMNTYQDTSSDKYKSGQALTDLLVIYDYVDSQEIEPLISVAYTSWLDKIRESNEMVELGHYEQDDDLNNGLETIQWSRFSNSDKIILYASDALEYLPSDASFSISKSDAHAGDYLIKRTLGDLTDERTFTLYPDEDKPDPADFPSVLTDDDAFRISVSKNEEAYTVSIQSTQRYAGDYPFDKLAYDSSKGDVVGTATYELYDPDNMKLATKTVDQYNGGYVFWERKHEEQDGYYTISVAKFTIQIADAKAGDYQIKYSVGFGETGTQSFSLFDSTEAEKPTSAETVRLTGFDIGNGYVSLSGRDKDTHDNAPLAFPFPDGNLWGLVGADGSILLSPQYQALEACGNGFFIAQDERGKKAVIDVIGSFFDPQFDTLLAVDDGIFLLQSGSGTAQKQFLFHAYEGCAYDFSMKPAAFLDRGHLMFLDDQRQTGLYDLQGEVLLSSEEDPFVQFYDDGRIGVTCYSEATHETTGMLLQADGTVDKSGLKDGWWWPSTVPVFVSPSTGNPKSWTIFFTDYTITVKAPNELYGVVEGWWSHEGEFFSCLDAERLGLTKENATHVATYFIHYNGEEKYCIRLKSRSVGGGTPNYLNPSLYTVPMQTVNGYTILYSKAGVPYYADSETLPSSASSGLTSYNNMAFFLSNPPYGVKNISQMALSPVSSDGIGIGEIMTSSGQRHFIWLRMNHWENGRTVHVLDTAGRQSPVAMSAFVGGSAVLYGADGKVGLIDEYGSYLLPIEYDRIEQYNGYAVAIQASGKSSVDDFVVQELERATSFGRGVYSEKSTSWPMRQVQSGKSFLVNVSTGEILEIIP